MESSLLSTWLAGLGLECQSSSAFSAVDSLTIDKAGKFNAVDFLQSIWRHSSLLWEYIQGSFLPDENDIRYDRRSIIQINSCTISVDNLLIHIKELSVKHRVTLINEMHLFLATIICCQSAAEVALAPLAGAYRQLHPEGNRYQQRILEKLSNEPSKLAGIRKLIYETPFSVRAITHQIYGYVSSEFYPFRPEDYARFEKKYPSNLKRDAVESMLHHHASKAFRCHLGQIE